MFKFMTQPWDMSCHESAHDERKSCQLFLVGAGSPQVAARPEGFISVPDVKPNVDILLETVGQGWETRGWKICLIEGFIESQLMTVLERWLVIFWEFSFENRMKNPGGVWRTLTPARDAISGAVWYQSMCTHHNLCWRVPCKAAHRVASREMAKIYMQHASPPGGNTWFTRQYFDTFHVVSGEDTTHSGSQ